MSIYGEKPRTLIEQKKLQWAKEREELANLAVPWGKTYAKIDKNSVRPKNLSKFSSSEVSLNREEHYSNRNLPPISRNKNYNRYDGEGDTSGYASDSAKEGTPEYYVNSSKKNYNIWMNPNWNQRSSESEVSSGRDERPKWGDRGLGVGHLWEPHELNERFSKTVDLPGWMQRSLEGDKEVMIFSHSPDQVGECMDRPFTEESDNTNMHLNRTHLRGQNIPLEPTETAERERKRQKALELQTAIKQQLEEREIKRKQDRERRLREEAEEESRIRREQEIERQRAEEEQKMMKEKKEREKKRNKAMHEALENAERQAKLEKSKQKHMRMKSNVLNLPDNEPDDKAKVTPVQNATPVLPSIPPPVVSARTNISTTPSSNRSNSSVTPDLISPVNNIIPPQEESSSHPDVYRKQDVLMEDRKAHSTQHQEDNHIKIADNLVNENLALVLQNPFDNLQGMQLAFLVPTVNMSNTLPLAALSLGTERSSITENRVLTPSVYRIGRNCRESSTQTENSDFRLQTDNHESNKSDNRDEKFGSLERRRDSMISDRKERRLRSEERTRITRNERSERPKWGVNRPPMRYLKQSEKDPAYQKRKMRQKTRETKVYEDKNNNYSQSSDDSAPQTPDHRVYRKQSYNRNMWHKNERLFSQNISVYQTEIVPLELDRQGRVYVKDRTDYRESERVLSTKQVAKRLEKLTPRAESRKAKLNDKNERKKLENDESSFEKDDSEGIIDKLNNLRHGLLLKQQQWDNNDDSSVRTKSIEFPDVYENS